MTTSDYLEQLQQDREDLVDNLEAKGITGLTGDETFTQLVPEVLNIPSGGSTEADYKDVNFYDYDGTRVYSYTKSEFLLLESMPSNPTHEGLTNQGWNFTLSDAKTFVTDNDKLDIGQLYVTSDGKTRIYIKLEEGRLSPYCGFGINGTTTIDWGDGTSSTVTGSNIATTVNTQHNYTSAGSYVISISNNSKIRLQGINKTTNILWNNNSANSVEARTGNYPYSCAIKKIEVGNNVEFGSYALRYCDELETITIPNNFSIGRYTEQHFNFTAKLKCIILPSFETSSRVTFNQMYNLKKVIFSNWATSNKQVEFTSCPLLKDFVFTNNMAFSTGGSGSFQSNCREFIETITLNNTMTILREDAFKYCNSLKKIKIPNSIIDIPNNSFMNCYRCNYFDFSTHTVVPTLGTGVFSTSYNNSFKIIVPDSLYEDWIVANNWSTYSSYIISKSDWDNL